MHLLILDGFAGTGSGHTLSFTQRLAQGASQLGWEVTVVAPHPPEAGPLRWEPIEPFFEPERPAWRNHLAARRGAQTAGRSAQRHNVDLIIDAYLHDLIGFPRLPAGDIPRVRITHNRLTVRTKHVRRPSQHFVHPHAAQLQRLIDDGDALAALTQRGVDDLRSHVPSAKVLQLATPVQLEVKHSAHQPHDPPLVGFLGEPRPDKGWPELLEALEHVRTPMRLVVIGAGTGELPALANENVQLEAWRDTRAHSAFTDRVAAVDAVVLPHTDAFVRRAAGSGVALEALAAGQPLLAGTAIADQIPSDPVAYRHIDPADPATFAKAIEALLDDLPVARAAAQRTGPAFVAAHHDPATILSDLARCLGVDPDDATTMPRHHGKTTR